MVILDQRELDRIDNEVEIEELLTDEDSVDTCDLCHGTGTVTQGEYDNEVERTCICQIKEE